MRKTRFYFPVIALLAWIFVFCSMASSYGAGDLVISMLERDPWGIVQGQEVTFTAWVENHGEDPIDSGFSVDFLIDGYSIGTQRVDQILGSGQSVQVSQTWIAEPGDSMIEVIADSDNEIDESDEWNNQYIESIMVHQPDLVVDFIEWMDPVEAGEPVILTVWIMNQSEAPVEGMMCFDVEISIDGQVVSEFLLICENIEPYGNVTVDFTWTAEFGGHEIYVRVDTFNDIEESDEWNNDYGQFIHVGDTIAPRLVSTEPVDGATESQVDQVAITLSDPSGVDIGLVTDSITVVNSSSDPVGGTSSEDNNVFTFTPDLVPLPDDTYQVSFTAVDMAGNDQAYSFSFTVDSHVVPEPTITGGIVTSGVLQPRPVENRSNNTLITITGTRGDNTGIKIRGGNIWSDTHSILRVGTGQEFSTIQSAVDVAVDGDTVLIDPGLYEECVTITKWINIKGNTVNGVGNEVIVNGTNQGNITFGITHDCPFPDPIYVEGLTLKILNTPYWTVGARLQAYIDGSYVRTSGQGKIIWNKCNFIADINKYPFGYHRGANTQLEFINCYFEKGYSHFLYMNQPWSLKRSQVNDTFFSYLSTFAPDPMDSVSTSSPGYGPNYGPWNLTQCDASVDIGSGDWSVSLALAQGTTALEIWAEDDLGRKSMATWVDLFVDSVTPDIISFDPSDDALMNAPPTEIIIEYLDETSGLSLENSTHIIKDSNLVEASGSWSISGDTQLIFTPSGALDESVYTVDIQLEDNLGNRGTAVQSHFTIDTTPPPPPDINDVESPTHNPGQLISGTKEAYANILLNGEEVVAHTEETTWSHTVSLTTGTNILTFAAQDRAENQSDDTVIEIIYDDIPPLPVSTLAVNGEGDGTFATLDWTGYDESAHGDIASYRIYAETSGFTDVSALTVRGNVNAGVFSYTVQNLVKGTTYWFAVVAVDIMGNSDPLVTPVTGVPTDIVPPENATNLRVECHDTNLIFSWDHSADTHGDLAGYKVYFNGATEGVSLPSTQNSHEQTGLTPATSYPFKVTAYDTDDNESSGVTISGITLLPNPNNLAASPYSGYVELSWDGVEPSQYVKHYAVYVDQNDFSTVQGMTPALISTGTSANVAGLTNDTPYFFAVTAVNLSDGERETVVTVPATPVADTQGPDISNVSVDGLTLTQGHTITGAGTFTLNAADPSGVSRVEFSIDGTLVNTDYNGSPHYSCYWNIIPEEDGPHTLTIVAYDTLGNSATLTYTLQVSLAPPAAPTITQPADGLVTNEEMLTVTGTAEKDSEVELYNNSSAASDPAAVDGLGNFSISLTLTEGENQIQARAQNRAGTGPLSNTVTVTLDTTVPPSPTHVSAQSREGGVIRVTWRAPLETSVKGYNLYRAPDSFAAIGEADRVNPTLITSASLDDLPADDGVYYYRVTTVGLSDNESPLSDEASAESDSVAPRAASVEYTAQGNYDPQTGRIAPGRVDVLLVVSESLQSLPFFSMTPEGGASISVEMDQVSDLEYSGFFIISDTTPTGTAYAVFSGRDLAGNRGTEIDAGASILVDTDGPALTTLSITPPEPIQNDEAEPKVVTVIIGLSEAMNPGDTPLLSYLLSSQGREPVSVDNLIQVTPQGGEAEAWQGSFSLPGDGGLAEVETFRFAYQGVDDLSNINGQILCPNLFQVYQGDLPPLEPPEGLTGQSLPGGNIRLNWNEVEQAVGYQLYRKAPGEDELIPYNELGLVLEFVDEPSVEGTYTYSIASIREENEQQSTSGMSAPVDVLSDSTLPGAPQNLGLELVANGIKAEWEAPPYTEPITYSLYRSDAAEITSVAGLTPLATGITQTLAVDPNPSPTDHAYVVTAVDEAGNESAPSNSFYLNFDLLPISGLHVAQEDNNPPLITWTHPGGGIAGYDIYLGPEGQRVKLNQDLLTDLTYIDTGYNQYERIYTVIAVDINSVESVGRSITLPVVRASLSQEARIKRGIMNRLEYLVENASSQEISNGRLKVLVEGHDHMSELFTVGGGAAQVVPVVVGGYDELPDVAALVTTIELTPDQGATIRIMRTSTIEVDEGMLVLEISNQEFTRGGTGTVWFTLENIGDGEIEIITARNSGNAASNDIIYYLMDEDENVLSSVSFKQAVGDHIVTLSNGDTVARVPAGARFRAQAMDITVPANAPDNVTIRLAVSNIYYHRGKPEQVRMDGMSTTHELTLMDTSYYGEVTGITPDISTGDQDILVFGRALERATGDPLPEVPLNLVISVNGFDRAYQVFTNADGDFSYTFRPLSGESGTYTVRAMHPDVTDRPIHDQFVITSLSITPSQINLDIPTNYEQVISIRLNTGHGTEANNVTLVYEESDQPQGVFPAGVHITLPDPISHVGSNEQATLPFTIWADNTAEETGTIILKVKSDETDPDAWGSIRINTHFSEAQAVLYFTPDHIETGVSRDDTDTVSLMLKNIGLADLNDVQIATVNPDGSPAPSWVRLNSTFDQGAIQVGEEREISISFSPTPATASEGIHTFYLRVTSANYQTTDIGLYVSVTQSGSGSVIFKVSDIYTGALDDNNDIIQGLSGARIKVQNEEVLTVEQTVTTDGLGEAFFEDLPAGRYKCRITADSHQEYIGRLWIKPGITMNEEVFLDYNLVTVEWEVNEITIEDRYEIVLKATYQTDVPAPVVIADPLSMTLPEMEAGDVFNGEFTLTNYGLIRAEEMTFSIPADDQFFSYELLAALPESLEAKQYVTIPYRVTCLQSPSQEDEGSGGGCVRYDKCVNIGYKYVCINGVITRSSLQHCWSYTEGECSGGSVYYGGGGGGGGSWGVGGGSGGGSWSSPAPTPTSIEGGGCLPNPPRGGSGRGDNGGGGGTGNGGGGDGSGCDSGGCPGEKDTNEGQCQVTGSGVDLLMREYNRSRTDLSVKVPGGNISAQRWYYDGRWWLSHIDGKLEFIWSPLGDQIESIELNRVVYEGSSLNPGLYIQGTNRITKTADGYHWTNKRGAWREFDESGRIVSYGSRKGIISKLLYEEGEDGPLIGATDRNDNQALWYEYNGDGLVSAVYDTENRRVEYEYANSLLTLVRDVLGRETGFVYDDEGRIITVTEPGNRQYTITYNAVGLLSSVVDSAGDGYFFEFDYDKAKREYYAQTRSSSGMIKEAWYDRDGDTKNIAANGRTLKNIQKDGRNLIVIDEKGNTTRKEYDEWDNLTKVLYPDGSQVTHEYDLRFNKKSRTTDERGVLTEYEYDDTGNLTRRIEASGTAHERITEQTYDNDGNLLTTKRLADANTAEAVTTMTYDAPGNMTSVTDPEGNMTAFTSHDVMGNVLTKIDAGAKEWTYQYDVAGRLRTITDPLNNITGIFYDERGNKIRQVDAEAKETTYEYDSHDNMIKRTDALGNETLFEYNTDNKLLKQTDPEAKEIHYEYDNEGRLTRTIDGNGNEIVMEYEDDEGCSSCSGNTSQVKKITYPTFAKEFSYDERGRKREEKDILSETEEYVTQFGYDLSGNLVSKTDKESKTTTYLYDDLGRLAQVRDPMNQDTHYVYDNRDNLIELTDANGRTTWFEYDGNNRLKKEIRPMTQETTYQYDGAGNLVEKIDSKNQKTEYAYDDAGRLLETRFFNPGDHVNPVKTVVFTYDKVGNLKTYDDGVTSAQYTYDDAYRKTSETVDYGAFQKTLSYSYYKNGLKETFTGPDSITYAYAYDENNQLAGVQIPNVGSVTISEYLWNRPASMSLPGGSARQFTYDPLMRVNSITAKDPGQNILMNYQYNYDNMDNINAKTTEHGDYQYGYDDLYRLNNVDNPTQDDEGFTYDPVGNRLTAENVAGTWSYNQNNELQSYGGVSYVYDDNGNMTQKTDGGVVTNYIYNLEDRLAEVRDGSGSLISSYYYDPFGRRLWKEVGGVRTYFHYADEGLIGEYDGSGAEIKAYGYKPGSTWTTDPLFMKVGSEYYFYHNDHLGTPHKMSAVNGAVVWSAKYESFGKATVEVETVENNLRFPGQYYDEKTELHYNYHRYYDSGIGRYLRVDPLLSYSRSRAPSGEIIFIFSVPSLLEFVSTLHPYGYVACNPITHIDPFGLYSWCLFKCDFLKFGGIFNCKVTYSLDYQDCFDNYILNTRECIENAKKKYEQRMKNVKANHKSCIKMCSCKE